MRIKLYLMAVWTEAKLEEAYDLGSYVLGGASPFTATNLFGIDKLCGYCNMSAQLKAHVGQS